MHALILITSFFIFSPLDCITSENSLRSPLLATPDLSPNNAGFSKKAKCASTSEACAFVEKGTNRSARTKS
jgi:hypothetical protein